MHRNLIMQTGMNTEQHTRRMGWLSKNTVYMVTKSHLHAKCHTTGAATDSTWQVNEQWMVFIDQNLLLFKLLL
ncbi:hypothetical protein MED222_05140 [Vibrio sp. MED222]|nr:hypothetical protein MED222_05140 [Vibrio sp. MED222]